MAKTKTTTKKTTKKSTGMTREEQSRELFKNIREYNLLGFRIGDGLHKMFNTLVTSISKGKATVDPRYVYTVNASADSAVCTLTVKKGSKTYAVDTVVHHNDPADSSLVLMTPPPGQRLASLNWSPKTVPFSEDGVREILREIKATK